MNSANSLAIAQFNLKFQISLAEIDILDDCVGSLGFDFLTLFCFSDTQRQRFVTVVRCEATFNIVTARLALKQPESK